MCLYYRSHFGFCHLTRYTCDETMIELKICENIAFLLTGFDNAQGNMVRI